MRASQTTSTYFTVKMTSKSIFSGWEVLVQSDLFNYEQAISTIFSILQLALRVVTFYRKKSANYLKCFGSKDLSQRRTHFNLCFRLMTSLYSTPLNPTTPKFSRHCQLGL